MMVNRHGHFGQRYASDIMFVSFLQCPPCVHLCALRLCPTLTVVKHSVFSLSFRPTVFCLKPHWLRLAWSLDIHKRWSFNRWALTYAIVMLQDVQQPHSCGMDGKHHQAFPLATSWNDVGLWCQHNRGGGGGCLRATSIIDCYTHYTSLMPLWTPLSLMRLPRGRLATCKHGKKVNVTHGTLPSGAFAWVSSSQRCSLTPY